MSAAGQALPDIQAVRHVAIIGGGTIGASWAAFFLSRGLLVSVYDPEPSRADYVAGYLRACWPTMRKLGAQAVTPPGQWAFYSKLGDATADAQYIQESAPDDFATKRKLYAELDEVARADAIIASSTSSLLMSALQKGLSTKSRFVVVHPFNPPHLIPMVEVVGGRATAPTVTSWSVAFMRHLGKVVLKLHKEVVGHVINRLQAALFREAIALARDGVADIKDIDQGLTLGPALRWALMGPFLTFHLAARSEGIRGYLHHLGPALERMWQDLGHIEKLTPELIELIGEGVDVETAGTTIAELLAERDEQVSNLVLYLADAHRRLMR